MVLVTGATGTVGRNLVAELLAAGERVRAMSRDPARARLPAAVEVVPGDLRRPATFAAALQDVRDVYLFPVADELAALLQAARAAAVRRLVLLSSAAAAMPGANAIGRAHAANEEAVRRSGLAWTFVRPTAFMANDLRWAAGIRDAGVVRAPFGQAATAPVDERDIAAVAATALLREGHCGRTYELTGPGSLTQVERVRILGEVLGRRLRFQELPPAAVRAQMRDIPPAVVESLLAMMSRQVGARAALSQDIEHVLRRPATPYRRWAARHAADFGGGGGTGG